jgi:transposase-like protein
MEERARTRRSFTDEFTRDAVAMVLDDGNQIVDVAVRLGVGDGTLGSWVRQARIDRGRGDGRSPSPLRPCLRHHRCQRAPSKATTGKGVEPLV